MFFRELVDGDVFFFNTELDLQLRKMRIYTIINRVVVRYPDQRVIGHRDSFVGSTPVTLLDIEGFTGTAH
jgi:hypothetical protein